MILNDFQRGRLPYFNPPPQSEETQNNDTGKNVDVNKVMSQQETIKEQPNVQQDFSDLEIGPNFEGKDLVTQDIDAASKIEDIKNDNCEIEDDTLSESDQDEELDSSKESQIVRSNDEELIDKNLVDNLTIEERNFLGFEKCKYKLLLLEKIEEVNEKLFF